METCFNLTPDGGFFSTDERKWITKIKKLAELYPESVTYIRTPEENDRCLYCKVPNEWFKIEAKRRNNLTEEQKAVIAERLKSARTEKRKKVQQT